MLYLHEAEDLRDLRVPPGNRLEALKGDHAGWFSLRINERWRLVFRWEAGQALDVSIVDYHQGSAMRAPKNPIHPGVILLEEFLTPAGETQAAFAERIGWTRARLNEFIRGNRGVTAAAALDLAEALGTTSKIWMNLQATWPLDVEAKRRHRAA
jgi:antitoxin HigA-1